jgi:hypothetical protein
MNRRTLIGGGTASLGLAGCAHRAAEQEGRTMRAMGAFEVTLTPEGLKRFVEALTS